MKTHKVLGNLVLVVIGIGLVTTAIILMSTPGTIDEDDGYVDQEDLYATSSTNAFSETGILL